MLNLLRYFYIKLAWVIIIAIIIIIILNRFALW